MKKLFIILICLSTLIACSKNNDLNQAENSNEPDQLAEENKFEDDLGIFILRPNLGESYAELPMTKIESSSSLDEYEELTEGLKESDESLKSEEEAGTLYLKLKDYSLVMIDDEPYQGDFYVDKIVDGKLEKSLISKNSLKDKIFEHELEGWIKARDIKENYYPEGDFFKIYSVKLVDKFFEVDRLVFLAWVDFRSYSFKDGIFDLGSGYSMPMEFDYKLDPGKNIYKFEKIVDARDGSEYYPSIKEMARGDEELAQKILEADGRSQELYDDIMKKLSKQAEKAGLENFRHEPDQIPGFEKDLVKIESGPNHIEGTIELARRKDYEIAKENKNKENWPHCEGVTYHIETKIAVKSIIDYFE